MAEDYGIVPWIEALLDDAPVTTGTEGKKSISPPPKFNFTANNGIALQPPSSTPSRGRGRPRASSPHKGLASANKATSPRKSRQSKAAKEANAISARQASESLQATLDTAVTRAETESVDGERANHDKVTVEVDSAIEINGDTETTRTNVKVEMPANSPDLPLPESTEAMIAKAKEMVEEARKLEGESSKRAGKRKAEELDDEEDEEKDNELQPAKKARLLQQDIKKERVRNRALFGVAATLAIGYVAHKLTSGPFTDLCIVLSYPTCSEDKTLSIHVRIFIVFNTLSLYLHHSGYPFFEAFDIGDLVLERPFTYEASAQLIGEIELTVMYLRSDVVRDGWVEALSLQNHNTI